MNPLGFELAFDPPDVWVRGLLLTLVPKRDWRLRANGDLWVALRHAALVRSLSYGLVRARGVEAV